MVITNGHWFQLAVGKYGEPTYVHSPTHTRAQREVLWQLVSVTDLEKIAEIERELAGALSGVPKGGGYGYGPGGYWFFAFELDGRLIVNFDFDREGEYGQQRLAAPRELEMPLADFTDLFRAWAASVRYWRGVGGEHGVPLPAEMWPTCYPPEQSA